MSWETRGSNGPYYTRSRKRQGKVTREYIGSGAKGVLFAELDDLEREERQAELARRREERAADERLEAMFDEIDRIADAVARAELRAAGYHLHKGQWRKRRGKET